VFREGIVDGLDEAAPEPLIVFGCEIGCVVWELFEGGRFKEDLCWVGAEDCEEFTARVGWEVEEGG